MRIIKRDPSYASFNNPVRSKDERSYPRILFSFSPMSTPKWRFSIIRYRPNTFVSTSTIHHSNHSRNHVFCCLACGGWCKARCSNMCFSIWTSTRATWRSYRTKFTGVISFPVDAVIQHKQSMSLRWNVCRLMVALHGHFWTHGRAFGPVWDESRLLGWIFDVLIAIYLWPSIVLYICDRVLFSFEYFESSGENNPPVSVFNSSFRRHV